MPASPWKRWAMPGTVALVLVPFVASTIVLIVRVGDDYLPSADQAWIELQIRDIGRRSVLLGRTRVSVGSTRARSSTTCSGSRTGSRAAPP